MSETKSAFATLTEQLSNHPMLLGMTVMVGTITAISNFVTTLSLPPVAADLATTGLIAVCTVAWAWRAGHWRAAEPASAIIVDPSGKQAEPTRTFHLSFGIVAIAAVLTGFCLWQASRPVAHVVETVRSGLWQICGSAVASCDRPCFRLNDQKGRPVSPDCVTALDDTGYIRVAAPSRFVYRPHTIVAVCAGHSDVSAVLEDEYFDGKCAPRKVLR